MLNLEATQDPFEALVNFVKAIVAPTKAEQDAISAAVRQGWSENFAGERSGDGRSWAALKPFTVRERILRGYPGAHPILVQSGRLRSSLLNPGAQDGYEQAQTSADGWTLILGTETPYALDHELGAGRIPARPFIALSDQAEQRIVSALDGLIAQIEARIL